MSDLPDGYIPQGPHVVQGPQDSHDLQPAPNPAIPLNLQVPHGLQNSQDPQGTHLLPNPLLGLVHAPEVNASRESELMAEYPLPNDPPGIAKVMKWLHHAMNPSDEPPAPARVPLHLAPPYSPSESDAACDDLPGDSSQISSVHNPLISSVHSPLPEDVPPALPTVPPSQDPYAQLLKSSKPASVREEPQRPLTALPLFVPPPDFSRIDPHKVAADADEPGLSVAPAQPFDDQLAPVSTELTTDNPGSWPTVDRVEDVPWVEQPIDWEAVASMRGAASTRLSTRLESERLDAAHQHSLGRIIITDLLQERASQDIAQGIAQWTPAYQAKMGQAVFDALFRLGRLQPLVDDDEIENIIISGADNVWLEYANGTMVRGPAVADTDQELIDFLSFIASRSQVNERSFSPAEPRLHLRLDSGARLAAAAWVTPRPSVVIRRHRLQDVTLNELIKRHTISPPTSRFLAQAVQRRASIVVSGAQGAGKTTLMRALCTEIDPNEAIGTFETEYELHLHLMPERHHIVHAWEARPGSGETDAAGHRAGEFLIDDALYDSFRFNLSRQIVGEVRGREILAMLKAMQSGSGSLSTTHAHSAEGAIRKLVTCAMEAGPHVTSAYATRAIAEDIDFIVHMEMVDMRDKNGKRFRHRWVKEILSVQPSDSARGYSTTRLFSTLPGEYIAAMETIPEGYNDVFDPMEELWSLS